MAPRKAKEEETATEIPAASSEETLNALVKIANKFHHADFTKALNDEIAKRDAD